MILVNIYIYRVVVWFSERLLRLRDVIIDVLFDVTVNVSPESLKILIVFFYLCSICGRDSF